MEAYDLSDAEILNNFEDLGRDPVRLWRLAVAHTSRKELAPGIVSNRADGFYEIGDRL